MKSEKLIIDKIKNVTILKWTFILISILCYKKFLRSFGVFGLLIIMPVTFLGDALTFATREDDDSGGFNIDVTFVDTSNRGPDFISLYIEEYPKYSIDKLDLNDEMYDDNPSTPEGEYTVRISMPQGLIENGDRFHVCVKDLGDNFGTKCFRLTNGFENKPEEITLRI